MTLAGTLVFLLLGWDHYMSARLTILIPVFRESEWLASSLEPMWGWLRSLALSTEDTIDVRFCMWSSGASEDATDVKIVKEFLVTIPAGVVGCVVMGHGPSPSVVASLRLALGDMQHPITSPYTLICPVDCSPTAQGLNEVLAWILRTAPGGWAVFPKVYEGARQPYVMAASAWLQNHLFSPLLGWHCWTHLFVVPTELLDEILQPTGFLEDLNLNRRMVTDRGRPFRFRSHARTSARRYARNGAWRQLGINVRIFLRYLLARRSAADLRTTYDRG